MLCISYTAILSTGHAFLDSRPLLKPRPFTELIEKHPNSSLEWSPVGAGLAATFADSTIEIYDSETLGRRQTFTEPDSQALCATWMPDGHMLAAAFLDGTVRLWNLGTGAQTRILEGHMDAVTFVAFSHDGQLLASKSLDDTVRLWRCDTWGTVAVLHEPVSGTWFSGLAFHPKVPFLATLGEKDTIIRIWELDTSALLSAVPVTPSVHYTNAKVVLIGDSGVGKSGLGLVLSGHYFTPTESSHGRHAWTFDRRTAALEGGRVEMHETLLWDLAGQPGYRPALCLPCHNLALFCGRRYVPHDYNTV
jgi:WD40 repeat protein